ncbi:unnamed protein product [Phyllotreta striolata]|uniref:G-protein coupled receptors family 1 profile domain-containing protein n=1 Tax=Phyllotreta striolata TaxID=444603 RepID=A0A9N9TLU2_PHYSR|nr:unnamed protein product [Phyllotreta striolata]
MSTLNSTTESTPDNSSAIYGYYNTTETFYVPYNERPETYFVPILFLIIFVVGVVGNGTLVAIFIKHKNMRNVPNMYILSLALADLLVILTSVPFTSMIYTMESWPWGELICKLSEFAKDISIGVSVFTLTALSADRFFAIVDPLKKFHTSSGGRRATRITVCTAASIWILAVVCAVPAAVASHVKGFPDYPDSRFFVCYPFPDWWNQTYPRVMVASKFLVFYVVPLTIIAVFYLSMAASLITSTRNAPGEMQGMHRQIKARKKVAVTVLVFVAVFAVCFAPLHIFMLFFYFHPHAEELYNEFWHYFRIIGFCLCYINSCANPIALYFVSAAFRKYFDRYLFCKKLTRTTSHSYPHQRATSMSLMSPRRPQSMVMMRGHSRSVHLRFDPVVIQETSVTLLGVGNDNACHEL